MMISLGVDIYDVPYFSVVDPDRPPGGGGDGEGELVFPSSSSESLAVSSSESVPDSSSNDVVSSSPDSDVTSESVVASSTRDIMTTPLDDYTVTEGLLLIGVVLMLFVFVLGFFKKRGGGFM